MGFFVCSWRGQLLTEKQRDCDRAGGESPLRACQHAITDNAHTTPKQRSLKRLPKTKDNLLSKETVLGVLENSLGRKRGFDINLQRSQQKAGSTLGSLTSETKGPRVHSRVIS